MRIAFVYDAIYPYSKGGVEKRVADTARALSDRGHEVHLVGTKQWSGPSQVDRDGVVLHGVSASEPMHLPSGRRSAWQAIRYAWSITRRFSPRNYDVIDVQNMAPLACLATLMACRLANVRCIVTWHEVWGPYWMEYLGWKGAFGVLLERLIASIGTEHVAVSATTANRLAALGVKGATIVSNGVDLTTIAQVVPVSDTKDFVFVGRLVPHKGLSLLVDALLILRSCGLVPTVAIIGEGPERDLLTRKADGVEGLEFLSSVDEFEEVISIVKSARVFVLPSTREGFGLAALEALACGVPVITVRDSRNAATELVEDEVTGLLVEPTAASLAQGMNRLLSDETLRAEMSRNALAYASRQSVGATADLLELTYSSRSYTGSSGGVADEDGPETVQPRQD